MSWNVLNQSPKGQTETKDEIGYFLERKDATILNTVPDYVKVSNGKKYIILKSEKIKFAMGEDVILSGSNIAKLGNATNVEITEVTKRRYSRYNLFHSKVWIVISFIIALAGVLVDGALKLGDKGIGWSTTKMVIEIMRYSSFVLSAVGVIVLFKIALKK